MGLEGVFAFALVAGFALGVLFWLVAGFEGVFFVGVCGLRNTAAAASTATTITAATANSLGAIARQFLPASSSCSSTASSYTHARPIQSTSVLHHAAHTAAHGSGWVSLVLLRYIDHQCAHRRSRSGNRDGVLNSFFCHARRVDDTGGL